MFQATGGAYEWLSMCVAYDARMYVMYESVYYAHMYVYFCKVHVYMSMYMYGTAIGRYTESLATCSYIYIQPYHSVIQQFDPTYATDEF